METVETPMRSALIKAITAQALAKYEQRRTPSTLEQSIRDAANRRVGTRQVKQGWSVGHQK